jgi:RNA recognition motif-containing protein
MSVDINSTVYVGSLPPTLTEENLNDMFSQYGNVISVKVMMDDITKKNKGYGLVTFDSPESATKSLNLHNFSMGDRRITVQMLPKSTPSLSGI